MVEPTQLTRSQLRDNPHAIWNTFVELLVYSEPGELSFNQRGAQLVFFYENEVQNGGHLQFFENGGANQIQKLVGALKRLGAECQASALMNAGDRWLEKDRPKIGTVEEYVETAREGEFDSADLAFHECLPPLIDVLEN
jgi:hypothetical protein